MTITLPAKKRKLKKKPKEKWKIVTELDNNWYSISQLGRVRINKVHRKYNGGRRRIIRMRIVPHIYNDDISPVVKLQNSEGIKKQYSVKGLVARYWLRPYNPRKKVKYIDRKSKMDCSTRNLYQEGMTTDRRLKLSDDEVRKLREEYLNENVTQQALADKYDVGVHSINDIIVGRRRRNVDDSSPYRRRNVQIECIRRYTGKVDEEVKVDVSLAKPSTWRNPPRTDDSDNGD